MCRVGSHCIVTSTEVSGVSTVLVAALNLQAFHFFLVSFHKLYISRNLFTLPNFQSFGHNTQSFNGILVGLALAVVSLWQRCGGSCVPSSKTLLFRGRDAGQRRPPAAHGIRLCLSLRAKDTPWPVTEQLGPGAWPSRQEFL